MLVAFVLGAAPILAFSGTGDDEQIPPNTCPKPYLEIDYEDQAQMKMLERDFISYETCFLDYAIAISERVNARKDALDKEVPEESWTAENEEEQVNAIEDAIEDLEAYGDALTRSRQDFEEVVRAILNEVPANIFNQWGAETKVAEP